MKKIVVCFLVLLWAALAGSAYYLSKSQRSAPAPTVNQANYDIVASQLALYAEQVPYSEAYAIFSRSKLLFPSIDRTTTSNVGSLPSVLAILVKQFGQVSNLVVDRVYFSVGRIGYRISFTQKGRYLDLRSSAGNIFSSSRWEPLLGAATDHLVIEESVNGTTSARLLGFVSPDQSNANGDSMVNMSVSILSI